MEYKNDCFGQNAHVYSKWNAAVHSCNDCEMLAGSSIVQNNTVTKHNKSK